MKRKYIVWDIDGPINGGRSAATADCYLSPNRNSTARTGEDPLDFIVSNSALLKLTLNILDLNNIESVIGSQRIHINEANKEHGAFVASMYKGLDHVLGRSRPYLREEQARKVGKSLEGKDTNLSKVMLLEAYQKEFKADSKAIILVDDSKRYQKEAEKRVLISFCFHKNTKISSFNRLIFINFRFNT